MATQLQTKRTGRQMPCRALFHLAAVLAAAFSWALPRSAGAAELLGDANHDCKVSGSDLISVQQNFGNCGPAPLPGDANCDGCVTGADLISVQENFGKACRELPPGLLELIRELENAPDLPADGGEPPVVPTDPEAPANVIRDARDQVAALFESANAAAEVSLRAALADVNTSWSTFAGGSDDLTHLSETVFALQRAVMWLDEASGVSDRTAMARIAALMMDLTDLGGRMGQNQFRATVAAGVDPGRLAAAQRALDQGDLAAGRGNYEIALGNYGDGIKLAADTVTFDVEQFRVNIIEALAGNTVGYAFSISYLGQLYKGGDSSGLARTSADAPLTAQSPSKEMHVASVSKTLTAILVHRLLEDNGLTPDALVAPYLPSNWVLGNGVENLRFRDFMTHNSGFNGAANSYEGLQTAIAQDVGSTSFDYSNANYGLMRVLVAGLMGIDPVDFSEFEPKVITASAFQLYANQIYNPIGVDIDCASNDETPTIQYNFPDGGASGYEEPNRQLSCGGVGWFISSNELAGVMAHLHQTENLMSSSARNMMEQDFLGYMDPARYGSPNGDYGAYFMHGGDWNHGSGELHACVAAFPIKVEVGLVINSERGFGSYPKFRSYDP